MPNYCCDQMRQQVEHRCEQHPDPSDCPDHLVSYSAKFDEYGLVIHDGGSAVICITFCPWCGQRLPESQRDRWFAELESQGINPWEDDVPERYLSDAWFRGS